MVPKRWSACRLQKIWGKKILELQVHGRKVFSWTWDFGIPSKFWGPYIDWGTTRHFYQGCWWSVWKLNRFGELLCFAKWCRNTLSRRKNSLSQGISFLVIYQTNSNSKLTSIYIFKNNWRMHSPCLTIILEFLLHSSHTVARLPICWPGNVLGALVAWKKLWIWCAVTPVGLWVLHWRNVFFFWWGVLLILVEKGDEENIFKKTLPRVMHSIFQNM